MAFGDLEPERLDLGQSAIAGSHGFGDLLRDRHVGRGKVGVVGNEDRPGANRHGASGGMDPGGSEIGGSGGVGRDRLPDPLELPLPHLREIGPLRASCGFRVEIDGDLELASDARGQAFGQVHRLVHGRGPQRHERDDIGGSHPGVFAVMLGQVDRPRRDLHHAKDRFQERLSFPHQADDGPIVVGVPLHVQHRYPRHLAGRGGDLFELHIVPPLGEVRNAFETTHGPPPNVSRRV